MAKPPRTRDEDQIAILNETVIRMPPEAFEQFVATIDAPVVEVSTKMLARLSRKAPWDLEA